MDYLAGRGYEVRAARNGHEAIACAAEDPPDVILMDCQLPGINGLDTTRRIRKLPGFGEMKQRILVAVLAKKFKVKPRGWEKHAATWHSVADVDSPESMAEARQVKRDMKAKAREGS